MLFAKEKVEKMHVSLCRPGDVIDALRGVAGTTITDN
jgi:hypothetical protein